MDKTVTLKDLKKYLDEKIAVADKDILFLYRLSSVNVDKVTFEKHVVIPMNTFDGASSVMAVISGDSTKVGTVTQKVTSELIPIVSNLVDGVAYSFEMTDKCINKINWV